MKKRYKKEAFYLDDGILLHGYKDKRGFHPDSGISCGFDLQVLNKKSIGKTLYFKLSDVISKFGSITLIGGKFIFAIDDGMTLTKIMYSNGDLEGSFKTETIVTDKNVESVIKECLNSLGVKEFKQIDVNYCLSSEFVDKKQIVTHKLILD